MTVRMSDDNWKYFTDQNEYPQNHGTTMAIIEGNRSRDAEGHYAEEVNELHQYSVILNKRIKKLETENAELKEELRIARDAVAFNNLQAKRKHPIVQKI